MRHPHSVRLLLYILVSAIHGSLGAVRLWPSGRVGIREVDAHLEGAVSAAIDDIERKTLVSFVRESDVSGSLAIRTAARSPAPGVQDVCCFDTSVTSQRLLSLALLQALGVILEDGMLSNKTAVGLRPPEADAVNRLYEAEVLPSADKLPALAYIGVNQIAPGRKAAADWLRMIEGRGRRVFAGISRWAAKLKIPGLVGAVPSFIFRGNKAQILLLGTDCAKHVDGSMLPTAPDEGLGHSIQRAMRYAWSKGFIGGLPTHQGDGSILLLRSPCATVASSVTVGETLESILKSQRSAMALATVQRWAQGQGGALYGVPSFTEPQLPSARISKTSSSLPLEVILVGLLDARPKALDSIPEQGMPFTSALTLAGISTGLTLVGCKFFKSKQKSQVTESQVGVRLGVSVTDSTMRM